MTLSKTTSRQSHQSHKSQLAREKSSNDSLAGHQGHLSEAQENALSTFKSLCSEKGLYTPADAGKPASHDDSTLLRFLRARKFDINGAYGQFKDTEDWRKENNIDALFENFDVESYEKAREVYPQWTGHRDKRGIPLYVYEIKHLNSKNLAAYQKDSSSQVTATTHSSSSVPPKLLRLFALYENMLRFVLPLCSSLDRPNPETDIVSTANIVDISGVGLKQFWNLKGHMQEASTLATAHYPETLDRIFIIGAPSFFPTVWGWIKRWFDPVTVSKIFILGAHEVESTLTALIDPKDLPKKFGGELDWEYGSLPDLDGPIREALSHSEKGNEFIRGPVTWETGRRIALGTVDGKERRFGSSVPPVQTHGTTLESQGTTDAQATTEPPATAQSATAANVSLPADLPVTNEKAGQTEAPVVMSEPVATKPTLETEKPAAVEAIPTNEANGVAT